MKPRFVLTVEAAPQADDADGTRRLRMALKSLLRRFGLRCVTVFTVDDVSKAGEATSNQVATAANAERITHRRPTVT